MRVAGAPLAYTRRGLLEARRRVGLVFQSPDDQLFSASVAQDMSFGPLNLGLDAAAARLRVAAAADLCGVADLLDRPTHALSGGQKTRVALAGVLAMEPLLILADEVTAGLDPWMRRQVFAIFNRLAAQGHQRAAGDPRRGGRAALGRQGRGDGCGADHRRRCDGCRSSATRTSAT